MICFVVLHYKNYEVTKKCLDRLICLKGIEENHIIVVDNGSGNGSGQLLVKDYGNVSYIDVVLNSNNLGFAKGNNVGYFYAKKNYSPEMIVVMNNDVMIEDVDFIENLVAVSKSESAAVIAPDVVNLNSQHQNPFMIKSKSLGKSVYEVLYRFLQLIVYSVPVLDKAHAKAKGKKTYIDHTIELSSQHIVRDIVPHGSTVIFKKEWIDKSNKAFYPGTFLFVEEEILYVILKKWGLQADFIPLLRVTHMEDQSTNTETKTPTNKAKFILKNAIKSRFQMIKVIISSPAKLTRIMNTEDAI